MKLAYVVNSYPLPSQTFIRREIHALERLDFQIHRFAMRGPKEKLTEQADIAEEARTEHLLDHGLWELARRALPFAFSRPRASLRALRLALACGARGAGGAPGTGGRLRHLVYWLEGLELARRCHQLRLPHIHAHFGTNSTTVAMLAAEIGCLTYSFTTHGPEEFDAPRAHSLAEKIARATFVVAISSYGRAQLCRWSAAKDWSRIKIVHCGIEPWRFAEGPAHGQGDLAGDDTGPHPLRLLAIGRLAEQKGLPILIEAMARLRHMDELQLTLVGDGPFRPMLEQAIETYGLGAKVHLTGWLDEAGVRAALSEADALVLPSFAEGLPMVVMEAFASARPVLATAIAGLPELVTPETGWLVPAGDAEALGAAIAEIAALPKDRLREMGKAARLRVLARHDIDHEAEKLADYFVSLAQ